TRSPWSRRRRALSCRAPRVAGWAWRRCRKARGGNLRACFPARARRRKPSAVTYRPSVILSVAAAALVACAAPGALADEPERPPPIDTGGTPPASARTTHLLAGAATTAVWYGGAVGFSYLWPDAP